MTKFIRGDLGGDVVLARPLARLHARQRCEPCEHKNQSDLGARALKYTLKSPCGQKTSKGVSRGAKSRQTLAVAKPLSPHIRTGVAREKRAPHDAQRLPPLIDARLSAQIASRGA